MQIETIFVRISNGFDAAKSLLIETTKLLRGWTALILALLITFAMSVGTFTLAILYNALVAWWSKRLGWKHPIQIAPALYGLLGYQLCYKRIAGVKSESLKSLMNPLKKDDVVILVANHFTELGLIPLTWTLRRAIGWRWTWVIRNGSSAIVRIPMEALGSVITINRGDRKAALGTINQRIPKLAQQSRIFLIHPDGSRPSKRKIKRDRDHFLQKLAVYPSWLRYTKFYKAGGTQELYTALAKTGMNVRIVHLVHGWNRESGNIIHPERMVNARFHAKLEEVHHYDIPATDDNEAWKTLMQKLCKDANRQIDFWRSHRKIREKSRISY
jgi:hypothetical protein